MQVTNIRLRSVTVMGTTTLFDLAVSSLSHTQSYILKDADGLDASDIMSQLYGSSFGSNLYKMVLSERKIDLLIKLNPQYNLSETPGSLRDALYKAISYTRQGEVQLAFMNGSTIVAVLNGFITKVESDIFSNNPTVKIGFYAKFPYLQAPSYTQLTFPVASTPIMWTDSLSTAPSGFRFEGTFNANASSIKFTDGNSPMFYFPGGGGGYTGPSLTVTYAFLSGDILRMGTEDQGRYLYIRRGGSTINLVDKVSSGSFWLQSMPGYNHVVIDDESKIGNIYLSYRPTYWGI